MVSGSVAEMASRKEKTTFLALHQYLDSSAPNFLKPTLAFLPVNLLNSSNLIKSSIETWRSIRKKFFKVNLVSIGCKIS